MRTAMADRKTLKHRQSRRTGLRTVGLLMSIAILACLCANSAAAAPGGPPRAMWLGNFQDITLANITGSNSESIGQSNCRLRTNCDVEITADNSTASRLTGPGGDFLVTEYALSIDGSEEEPFAPYDSFLSTPVAVDYNGGDMGPWMDLEVTLRVRASNPPGEVANTGNYEATQTLTAHW